MKAYKLYKHLTKTNVFNIKSKIDLERKNKRKNEKL